LPVESNEQNDSESKQETQNTASQSKKSKKQKNKQESQSKVPMPIQQPIQPQPKLKPKIFYDHFEIENSHEDLIVSMDISIESNLIVTGRYNNLIYQKIDFFFNLLL
jgi:hypothetical protein